jgi:hypothetical protein
MKTAKPIKLQTLFGQFMYDCFECILRELQIIQTNKINKKTKIINSHAIISL